MDTKKTVNNVKKPWVKPQLVVYGDIVKLTAEIPVPKTPPLHKTSGNM